MDKPITPTESFDPKRIQTRIRWEIVALGIISIIVSFAIFLLGIVLFPLTSALPGTVGVGENTRQIDWGMLDGIASLATMSLFIGGITFAFLEYVQTAIQRKRENAEASFNIYTELYDRLMKPESLAARRWVILNLPTIEEAGNDKQAWLKRVTLQINQKPDGWSGERSPGKEYIKEVLNTFDFLGFVAKHYWNMENELVQWMSPSIAKVWERIEYYVEEEARLRQEPDYYESAREFGKYCVEWRKKHYPQSKIIKNAT